MNEEKHAPGPADTAPIIDRPDTGGRAGTWWPLAALAIIALLLVRACIEGAAPPQPKAGSRPEALQRNGPG
jgi:hypothetical protein